MVWARLFTSALGTEVSAATCGDRGDLHYQEPYRRETGRGWGSRARG
jgi:hypothetical protein